MSFGTFMDSVLFNVQADLGSVAGEVSQVLAPITPQFVFDYRKAKKAEAQAKVNLETTDDEETKRLAAILFPNTHAFLEERKLEENNNEKPDTDTAADIPKEPLALETSKANPVDNVDEVLQKLANMANDTVQQNEFLEQLTKNNKLMEQVSSYMANEFVKDLTKELGSENGIPNVLMDNTVDAIISSLQAMRKNEKQ